MSAGHPWTCCLSSMSLGFLACKMGLPAVCLKQGLCEDRTRGHSEINHAAGATQMSPSSWFQGDDDRLKATYILLELLCLQGCKYSNGSLRCLSPSLKITRYVNPKPRITCVKAPDLTPGAPCMLSTCLPLPWKEERPRILLILQLGKKSTVWKDEIVTHQVRNIRKGALLSPPSKSFGFVQFFFWWFSKKFLFFLVHKSLELGYWGIICAIISLKCLPNDHKILSDISIELPPMILGLNAHPVQCSVMYQLCGGPPLCQVSGSH